MMKVLVLCFVATLWVQLPSGGDAECCRKHKFSVRSPDGIWQKGDICGDCSRGTPYCSFGGCNIFGCNCDGGCRRGLCDGDKFEHQIRSVPSEDAHDVIRAADQNGDGMMSIKEAHAHVVREALPTNQVKRTMKKHAHLAGEALPTNQVKRTMEAHAHLAGEELPTNQVKRMMEAHAHLAGEELPTNQVKRMMEAHAHLAGEELPTNQVKRTMEAHAHLAKKALPANHEKRSFRRNGPYKHLRRSLVAMDIDKDNFLSAKEIDSNSE